MLAQKLAEHGRKRSKADDAEYRGLLADFEAKMGEAHETHRHEVEAALQQERGGPPADAASAGPEPAAATEQQQQQQEAAHLPPTPVAGMGSPAGSSGTPAAPQPKAEPQEADEVASQAGHPGEPMDMDVDMDAADGGEEPQASSPGIGSMPGPYAGQASPAASGSAAATGASAGSCPSAQRGLRWAAAAQPMREQQPSASRHPAHCMQALPSSLILMHTSQHSPKPLCAPARVLELAVPCGRPCAQSVCVRRRRMRHVPEHWAGANKWTIISCQRAQGPMKGLWIICA